MDKLKQIAYVVSDLHIFSRRSEFPFHEHAILKAAAEADMFVLNGDTFDFRWTTLSTIDDTVDAAIAWLRDLSHRFPNCHFHVILGNHDHVKAFVHALDNLTHERSNLSCHPYYLRIGDSIFLHGDVSDRRMTPAMLERRRTRREHDSTRHPVLHDLYDIALRVNLHRAAHRMRYPRKRVARRVIHYLEEVGGPVNGIRHVYFGHTHAAMSNYKYGNLVFHNTGSPMAGLEFNILRLELDA